MIKKLSKKQLQALNKLHKLPKTQKQKENARNMGKKYGKMALKIAHKLPKSAKQLANSRKAQVFANDIIKHHNDLCHGEIRPDDITLMTHSEHAKLHMQLHIENGTHPAIK